jgi:transcriptional regulator with XRE-family HTH domain
MSQEKTTFSAVLGVVLSGLRQEKNIEQGEFSQLMGLSQASYSRLESGKATFSVDQMFMAAKALKIENVELLDRLNNTIENLVNNNVNVFSQARKNSAASDDSKVVGAAILGAGLGALLVGLAGRK